MAPRKNCIWRPIHNLRPLNTDYIMSRRVGMETLVFIIPTLRRGIWAVSLDQKDLYLQFPIVLTPQRLLAFEYQGKVFKFTALPFGLPISPRIFTWLAAGVVVDLRHRDAALCLSGQLSNPRGHPSSGRSRRLGNDLLSRAIGLGHQLGQVSFHPYSETGLF